MSKTVNVEVKLKQVRGDVNKLIRKFIKKCKKERILEDYLERRFYIKPSVKRRKEKLRKLINVRRAEEEKKLKIR